MNADELLRGLAELLAPHLRELLEQTPPATSTENAAPAEGLTPEILRERLKGAKGPSVYVNQGWKGRNRKRRGTTS